MQRPVVRQIVRDTTATIAGGRHAAHVERPARRLPGLVRREDGPHRRRGLVARSPRRARNGVTHLRDDARQPDARAAERRPRRAAHWGLSPVPRRSQVDRRGATYASRRAPATARRRRARRRTRRSSRSSASTGRSSSASSRRRSSRFPSREGQASARCGSTPGGGSSRARPLVAARVDRRSPGSSAAPAGTTRAGPLQPRRELVLVIVTVTLNAAIDRTLTVPNFQLGHRHRASQGLTLAGGKGINIARALKRLDVPVVATGLVGGRTGTRIVEELTARGDPQRLRPHRGRVAHVDRGRRPDRRHVHGDQRVGAARRAARSSRCCSRSSHYLARGADFVVFAGLAAARRRRRLLRRGDPRPEPARRATRARHRGRAAAARRRGRAVSRLAEPARGRGARRPGVRRATRTSRWRSRAIAELGARNVLITPRVAAATRCCARTARRTAFRARSAAASSRSRAVGAGDVLLAGFLAARAGGAPSEDALRSAVAAGAASTLEVGAGRFDPRRGAAAQRARLTRSSRGRADARSGCVWLTC